MSNNYRDFDAYFAEMQQDTPTLRLYGEDHTLSATLPVTAVLHFQRLQRMDSSQQLQDESIIELFASVFGRERADSWIGRGLDIQQMTELLKWAMERYGVSNENPTKVQRGKTRSRA